MKEVGRVLLDAAANALCLCMLLRMTGERIRPVRVALSALLGALSAQGLRSCGAPRAAVCWLPLAYGMAGIVRGRFQLRGALVLLAACGLLGGTVTALYGAAGSLRAAWGIGLASVLLMGASALRARRAACDVHRARVVIAYGGRTAAFDAMIDSGNCLRDYLTHRPVIVLPEAAARETLVGGDARLRPIVADTAGGRQLLACFTPQGTTVDVGGETRVVQACVALSPGLSRGAPALLPQALLVRGDGP